MKLGAGPELRAPLVRFLGAPDPLPDGLKLAMAAGVLEMVGGPRDRDRARLRRFATSGGAIGLVIPKPVKGDDIPLLGGAPRDLPRAIDRSPRRRDPRGARAWARRRPKPDRESLVPSAAPALDEKRASVMSLPAVDAPVEVFATLPSTVRLAPGTFGDFVVYATQNVEVQACAVVPLSEEMPPPPPGAVAAGGEGRLTTASGRGAREAWRCRQCGAAPPGGSRAPRRPRGPSGGAAPRGGSATLRARHAGGSRAGNPRRPRGSPPAWRAKPALLPRGAASPEGSRAGAGDFPRATTAQPLLYAGLAPPSTSRVRKPMALQVHPRTLALVALSSAAAIASCSSSPSSTKTSSTTSSGGSGASGASGGSGAGGGPSTFQADPPAV